MAPPVVPMTIQLKNAGASTNVEHQDRILFPRGKESQSIWGRARGREVKEKFNPSNIGANEHLPRDFGAAVAPERKRMVN
ncbi:hypothetical protein ZHAS_00014623 [Anopheles sinensis]|uniref:Uncharacterized protein n=1 Tax=Anopheles sinensis TaxID=74873 RepID=A0A084W8J6_ANOSI|nr:hypothetical protein ZHAS_00014623 [Anopheles sinensis]